MTTGSRWYKSKYLSFKDNTDHSLVNFPGAAVKIEDDFVGPYFDTLAAGKDGWTVQDTAGGVPSIVANQPGGICSLLLAVAGEEQEAGLYRGDALNLNIDKNVVFEARLCANVLPDQTSELYFGLASAYVKGRVSGADEGPTKHALFVLVGPGGGLVKLFTDDGSTDNDAKTTGITLVAGVYHTFRIVIIDVTDVRFYIDDVRVGATVTFDMSSGSNVVLQPYIMAYKAAPTTGIGELRVDYIKAYQLAR